MPQPDAASTKSMNASVASSVTTPHAIGPVSDSQRIASLDVLRGFALLGILVLNIQSFSMISAAYANPLAYGDLRGANFLAWFITYVFFEQKFLTIFSLLLGASIVMMTERRAAAGHSPFGLHCRRMFGLTILGLLHAYLLWYGDILFSFGVCGLVVYWFRKLRPTWLVVWGLLLLAVPSGISVLSGLRLPSWSEDQWFGLYYQWAPPPEMVNYELAVYRGGWLQQMSHRVPKAYEFQTWLFVSWTLWRVGGLMLIGMALQKWAVFSAARSKRFYFTWIGIAALIGFPIVLYGFWRNTALNWDFRYSFFFGTQFNYWGGVVVSLGYVSAVMLLCQSGRLRHVREAMAAIGQTTLSNYILQTLLCTSIFYGHGLGMFGYMDRIYQVSVVVAISIFQLVISTLWLKRFRFGPVEWVWRTLSYLRWQPMLRERAL